MRGGFSRLGPRFGLTIIMMLAFNTGLRAQMSATPPKVEQKIEELGRSLNPAILAATGAVYAPLQERPPYEGLRVHRNLKYGPAEDNRLDVFASDPLPADARPVLIFVHGPTFIEGGNPQPGSPFYDNVGVWAARHGLIGINITYRLAPQNPWPAAIEDIGAAIRWAVQNVAPYGGDPDKIFVMGHSSGASHVAGYISHPELQPPGGAEITGAILISGIYDLTTMQLGPNEKAYFGEDASLYAGRSSLAGLVKTKLPLLVIIAGLDLSDVEKQGNHLNEIACEAKHCPHFILLPKHNHMSEVYSINTKDEQLTSEILGFIKVN
jgi:acetyl esterase/lipase